MPTRPSVTEVVVSIHSRPKAAAQAGFIRENPPQFQYTAARRRLLEAQKKKGKNSIVSIHSRPKAAAVNIHYLIVYIIVSIHSRPKAAAFDNMEDEAFIGVSIHSRPKAAAGRVYHLLRNLQRFNTQPPEGGCRCEQRLVTTFARFNTQPPEGGCNNERRHCNAKYCFNTQPPEGGCR